MEEIIIVVKELGLPVAIAILTGMALVVLIKKVFEWFREIFEDTQESEKKYMNFLQTSLVNQQELLKTTHDILEQNSKIMLEMSMRMKDCQILNCKS